MLAQLGSAASRYARTAGGDSVSASRLHFPGVIVTIRPFPDSAKRILSKRSPGFISSDVAFVTYAMPGPSFLKRLIAHAFYLIVENSNHIRIFDV